MTIASETLLHQQAIQGRCFHPDTVWEEFPHAALEQSVVTRFEAMVVRYPDHLAVNMGDRCLTYTQLNSTANRVAHALLEHQGSGAEPIALLFEHGIDMIGALLGVLKAGKFYVPLNPDEPLSRLQTMVADTEAQVLLTNCRNRELAHTLSGTNLWPLEMETLDLTGPYPNPTLAIDIDAFAYLIYTSGSTGQPKGVIETHRNVLHFVWNHSNTEHYVPSDRCGLTRAYTFSGTASLLYSALLNGAAIALYDVVQQGIAGLANWFATDGITAVSLAPTIFRQFVGYVPQGEQFPALRLLRLGGDRVLPSDLDLYQRHFSANCIFQFGLGTSEVKVLTNYFVDHNTEFTEETVPAGYPVADIELLVLDEGGNELGFDQIGEIAVRSRYISPGYWRQPALTAARFLPVANDPTKHIYLTGDLGKLRADGCLFHVGRNDAQVKIMGQLVATIEVENALLQLESVQEAVVLACPTAEGTLRLVAYIVAQARQQPTVSQLRKALAALLPPHMIPTTYLFLEALPLNRNHKIDRRALPAPNPDRPRLDTPYVAPRTELERKIANLWQEILGIEPIGINDHFLDLGGDSIRTMMLINRLQGQIEPPRPIMILVDTPTVAELATYLATHAKAVAAALLDLQHDPQIQREDTPQHAVQDDVEAVLASPLMRAKLSPRQRTAVQALLEQLADPTQPQTWQAVIGRQGWHRRRKAIHLALSIPPHPWTCWALTRFAHLPWLRKRSLRKEEALTRHFLATLDQRLPDETSVLAKCIYLNCLHYYGIASKRAALATPVGMEMLRAAQSSGRGILFVTMHDTLVGKFDTGPLADSLAIGTIHNYLEHYQIQQPELEQALFSEQLQVAHRALQSGGAVRIAPDGHRGPTGIEVDFHGRRRLFRSGFAELAVLTDATVIAVLGAVDAAGRRQVKLVGPLDPGTESTAYRARVERLVSQYTALLHKTWAESPWMVPWYQMARHLAYPPSKEA